MSRIEVRFSGSGGQGLILSAKFLSAALTVEGKSVAQSQSYEPVSRGGLSRSDLVVSSGQAGFPPSQGLDYLVILDGAAANASDDLLRPSPLVMADADLVPTPPVGAFDVVPLPFVESARKLGNKRVANIVALSALVARSRICGLDTLEHIVRTKTPKKFARLNMEAFEVGKRMGVGVEPA